MAETAVAGMAVAGTVVVAEEMVDFPALVLGMAWGEASARSLAAAAMAVAVGTVVAAAVEMAAAAAGWPLRMVPGGTRSSSNLGS